MQEQAPFYYQKRLQQELMDRIDRNPRYSLRSFSIALGLGPTSLSQILSGKRSISTKIVERIFQYLELNHLEQKKFLESILDEKKKRGLKRTSPELVRLLHEISRMKATPSVQDVGLDEFRIIADWYHYAILELTCARNFKPDARWIAKELGLSVMETKFALERLLKLELLEERDGTLKKTNLKIDTKDKTKTSVFHQKRQKQVLEKSIHSLEQDPIEDRNHTSITFCADLLSIPQAKAKIQNFMWELAQSMVEGNQERVYELTVNLFPLQNKNMVSTGRKLGAKK